ncbi:hypothetical protein HDU79_005962 [Rhizoclosmatium sp. JEL0117]|nr:hypothetical protein HDU79_005962 [Rhizoclosmatium sp. JEL0117]
MSEPSKPVPPPPGPPPPQPPSVPATPTSPTRATPQRGASLPPGIQTNIETAASAVAKFRSVALAAAAARKASIREDEPILGLVKEDATKQKPLRHTQTISAAAVATSGRSAKADAIRARTVRRERSAKNSVVHIEPFGIGSRPQTLSHKQTVIGPRILDSDPLRLSATVHPSQSSVLDAKNTLRSPLRPLLSPDNDDQDIVRPIVQSPQKLKIDTLLSAQPQHLDSVVESPSSLNDGSSESENAAADPVEVLVSQEDLADMDQVVLRQISAHRHVKLYYAEDIKAFDQLLAWSQTYPEKTKDQALEEFCPKMRSGDALVSLIYGVSEWDYVLTYKHSHTDHEHSAAIRDLFEEKLLKHGIFLEIEHSQDKDHTYFVKVLTPFHFLVMEAYKMGLQFPLKEPIHSLDEDAHPPEQKPALFGLISPYHLNLNKHTSTLDPHDLSSFEFKLETPTNEQGYVWANVSDQPCHIVLTQFFERRYRLLLAHHVIMAVDVKIKTSMGVRIEGINYLIAHHVYHDFFPVHGVDSDSSAERKYQKNAWRNVTIKKQDAKKKEVVPLRTRLLRDWVYGPLFDVKPIELVREYLGEEIAFYFIYLEYYNRCLIYSSFFGLVVFIYGIADYFVKEASGGDSTTSSPEEKLHRRSAAEVASSGNSSDATGGVHQTTLPPENWKVLFDNALTPWFAFVMSLWSVIYVITWMRRCKYYAFKWSMHNHEPPPIRRVEFRAVGVKKSPITNKYELYYPEESRTIRKLISGLVILGFFGISCSSVILQILLILHMEDQKYVEQLIGFSAAMLAVLLIQICRRLFHPIAHMLNEWENYRTTEEFEQALVTKQFAFEFVNIYCHIIYFAFIHPQLKRPTLFGFDVHTKCSEKDVCSADVIIELLVIFIMDQFIERFEEYGIPQVKKFGWFLKRRMGGRRNTAAAQQLLTEEHEQGKLGSVLTNYGTGKGDEEKGVGAKRPQYYRDAIRSEYEGLYEDYFPKAIQYGYVTMFVTAFPLAPIFALFNNVIENRMDLYKFLKLLKRAPPFLGAGIGVWEPVIKGTSILAVTTNGMLVAFSSEYFFKTIIYPYPSDQWMTVRLTFLIIWHLVIFSAAFVILWIIPDEPKIVKIARAREEYLEQLILDPSCEAADEEYNTKPDPVVSVSKRHGFISSN